jgi:hypothetical protein
LGSRCLPNTARRRKTIGTETQKRCFAVKGLCVKRQKLLKEIAKRGAVLENFDENGETRICSSAER